MRNNSLEKSSQGERRVIFRADGSSRLGIGHIMRCIALAQGLRKIGINSIFIIRGYEQKIIELVQNNDYDVEIIPKNNSLIEDASLTLNFASRYCANVIIIDMSNTDTLTNLDAYKRYLQTLKSNRKFLVTIDGLDEDCSSNKIPIPSGIVVIPYLGAENRKYKSHGNTNYLLGPAYFIFRDEFIKAARIKREINREAQNILVTMGGSDPSALTVKIANALVKLNRISLNLRFVIGPGFNISISQELKIILADFNGNYELVIENFDMAELMFWSDLAIISNGLTKYETAVTGTPSIVISYNDFREKIVDEFERYGSTLYLGQGKNIYEDDIAKVVNSLLDDNGLRRQMSKKGRNLVDGKGAERVISQIPTKLLS